MNISQEIDDRKGKLTTTSHSLQGNTAKVPIGLRGFQFSQDIANKYGISRRYWRLPLLIFSRLYDKRAAEKKINIYHKRLIDNIFTSHFLYLKVIIQLIHTSGSHSYFQKLQDINKRKEVLYQSSANQNVSDFYWISRNLIYSAFTTQSWRVKNELQQNNVNERNPIYSAFTTQSRRVKNELQQNNVNERNSILVPFLYQRTGLADIPSSFKDIATATFFQNIVDVKKASSKQDRRIHYPASLIRPLHYKRQFSVKMLFGTLESKNKVPNLQTRAATIALDSVKPIIKSHLKRTVDSGNNGLKVNRSIYPLPSEIQASNKDTHSLELSTIHTVPHFTTDKNAVTKRPDKPLLQDNRITNNIKHEKISKEDEGNGRNILFSVPHLQTRAATIALDLIKPIIKSHLQRTVDSGNNGLKVNRPVYPLPSEIQALNKDTRSLELSTIRTFPHFTTDKNAVTKRPGKPLLQDNRVTNNIKHEKISKEDEGIGRNILFSVPHLQTRAETIALDSVKPIIESYLQRTVNVNNVSLKNNIAIYPLSSELQVLNEAGPSSELLPIKSITRSSADKNSIIRSADIPLMLRKSVLFNIIYGIPYEDGDEGGNGNLMYAFIRRTLKRTTDLFSEKEFFLQGINFKYADHVHKKRNSPSLQDGTSDIYHNSLEMVHKKPMVQKIDADSEVDEFLPLENKTSTRLSESLIKESSVETQTREMSIIAEKVYKIIEKKISIEKDRRGLF